MITTEAKGKFSDEVQTEQQAGTNRLWLIRMLISLLIVSVILAVVQWGLHHIKNEGLKAINELTNVPTGFEDEVFEVPEDTVTYKTKEIIADDELVFVTYTKYNPKTRQTYVGHSKGYGSPQAIVKARDKYHHRNPEGFLPAVLDKYSIQKPEIRGREQQIIDYYGGAWSDRKKDGKPTRSGNKIRAVSKTNRYALYYHEAANRAFGETAKYTGF